jgi:hypothetical protein
VSEGKAVGGVSEGKAVGGVSEGKTVCCRNIIK